MKKGLLSLIALCLFAAAARAQTSQITPINARTIIETSGAPVICVLGRLYHDTNTNLLYSNKLGVCTPVSSAAAGSSGDLQINSGGLFAAARIHDYSGFFAFGDQSIGGASQTTTLLDPTTQQIATHFFNSLNHDSANAANFQTAWTNSTASSGPLGGVEASVESRHTTGALTFAEGVVGVVVQNGAGTVTHAEAFDSSGSVKANGRVTNYYGFRVHAPSLSGGGDITGKLVGVQIEDTSVAGASAGTVYNLLSQGVNSNNQFDGNVNVGGTLSTTHLSSTGGTLTGPTITAPLGITKADVGLGNVDNTADVNKPITYPYGPPLPNAAFRNGFIGNAASGDVDVYTCPTNKRCAIYGWALWNTAGTTTTYKSEVKISGTYYRIQSSLSASANALTTSASAWYIAEGGETLAFNFSQAGINVWYRIVEFDNTAALKSVKALSLAAGDNTIYTVPAGKTAFLLSPQTVTGGNSGGVGLVNDSGGTRTYNLYCVPSGGTKGSSNQVGSTSFATANLSTVLICPALNAGDFFVVNADAGTATQWAWLNVIER